jgi:hypothetical protein
MHDADADEDADDEGAEAASIAAAQVGRRLRLVLAITIYQASNSN